MSEASSKKGISLVELIVVIGLIATVSLAIAVVASTGYKNYQTDMQSLVLQSDAQTTINKMEEELRELTEIETAEPNQIVFYANIKKDTAAPERIRYFVDGTSIKRGVTYPEGSPEGSAAPSEETEKLSADTGQTEQITTLTNYLIPADSEIFTYYNSQNPPQVVTSTTAIALIEIKFSLDDNPNKDPNAYSINTCIQPRNQKSN